MYEQMSSFDELDMSSDMIFAFKYKVIQNIDRFFPIFRSSNSDIQS